MKLDVAVSTLKNDRVYINSVSNNWTWQINLHIDHRPIYVGYQNPWMPSGDVKKDYAQRCTLPITLLVLK